MKASPAAIAVYLEVRLALACVLLCLAAGAVRMEAQSTIDGDFPAGTVRLQSPQPSAGDATVVLELADDPVAVVRGRRPGRRLAHAEQDQIARTIRLRQDALVPLIRAQGVRVMSTLQHAINGIKVRGTPAQIAALAQLPGIVAVKPVLTYEIENSVSVPFIGAPSVWSGTPGILGEHVKVGVIDTGVDYTHANFGGPGTVAAYQAALATDTAAPSPSMFGAAAPKIKGGTDLVGDNYNSASTDPARLVPHPDPNPLDCNGHGSHVAGTIAGFGVLSTGATFHGPYDPTTELQSFTIGPGVAPGADLYSIRVFGCTGSTDMTVEAIDWAVANEMDVVNLSLGSPYGAADSADSEAATNAAAGGMIVAISAGNNGSVPYILGSPGAADKVITVAAMDARSPRVFPAANGFLTPSGQNLTLLDANGGAFTDGVTLSIVVLRNANGTMSSGCIESEYKDATITGKLVVMLRGTCNRTDHAIFGQRHGAAAVAMINNAAGYSPFEEAIPGVTIPFFSMRGSPAADGTLLAVSTAVTLTKTTLPDAAYHTMATFSSTGPRGGDGHFKPDVSAPGVNIFSTLFGSGTGGEFLSGTSMASPHVAGVAALEIQAHPTWDRGDVRLGIVNTADSAPIVGYLPRLSGGGVVQALAAMRSTVVAEGNDGAPNLSFGAIEFTDDYHGGGDVALRNLGDRLATFNVTTTAGSGSVPHSAVANPSSVAVAAGQSAVVHLDLTVPAATTGNADGFRELAGLLRFVPATATDNNGVSLTVPYHAVPRARAQVVTAIPDGFGPSGTTTVTARVSNFSPSVPGSFAFYNWGLKGSRTDLGAPGLRAVGVKSFVSSGVIEFAVDTFGPISQLFGAGGIEIDMDTTGDGVLDYAVYADSTTFATSPIDRVITLVYNFHTRTATTSGFVVPYHTDQSTFLLPVRMSSVGLSGANPRFRYSATIYNLKTGQSDTLAGPALFNAFNPAIRLNNPVVVSTNSDGVVGVFDPTDPSTNGFDASLTLDPVEWSSSPALGVMVVNRDNFAGAAQAQLIAVPTATAALQSITIMPASASLVVGEWQQFHAIATFSDGTDQDVTAAVTWSSSADGLAGVSASGNVWAVSPGGPAVITATHDGIQGTSTVSVQKASTTTARSVDRADAVAGELVTFNAAAVVESPGAGIPTGTVTFYDGAAALGTRAVINGTSAFTTSLTAGQHSITARYDGDTNFLASTSGVLPFTVAPPPDTTPPVITVTGVFDGQYSNAAGVTPIFSATDDSLATVTATLDDAPFVSGTMVTAEGPHTFVVSAADTAGNRSQSIVHFTLDRTPPTLDVASPAEGAHVVATMTTFSGTVSDANAVFVTVAGTPVPAVSGNFSTSVALTPGANTIAVVVTDVAGNSTSLSRHVFSNVVPPALTLQSPINGLVTNAASVEVRGLATPGDPADVVTVTVQGETVAVLPDGSFSAAVALVDGANTIIVVATDGYGLRATAARSVIRDATPPAITISGVADGQYSNAAALAPAYSATDENLTTVTATIDGAPFVSGAPVSTEGAHSLVVIAADAAGNQSGVTVHFTLDRTPPVLIVASPLESAQLAAASTTVTGTVADGTLVSLSVQGLPVELAGSAFSRSVALAPGANTITAIAVDAAGNTTVVTRTVRANVIPPTLVVNAPANGLVTNKPNVQVHGIATPADAQDAVMLTVQGVPVSVAAGGGFGAAVSLADGTNTITVVATDGYGLQTTIVTTVVQDTTPPTITLSGVTDGESSNAPPIVPIFSAGDANLASVAATLDGAPFVSGTPVTAEGSHSLVIIAADTAGNQSSVTVHFTMVRADGAMHGLGHIDEANRHHHFVFRVSQLRGADDGRFEYWTNDPRQCHADDDDERNHCRTPDRFEATAVTDVVFTDDPAFTAGRGRQPDVDSVSFAGVGRWNGRSGYTFEVQATDRGEPGRGRDTLALAIRDAGGTIVASVSGTIDGGNIQSTRVNRQPIATH